MMWHTYGIQENGGIMPPSQFFLRTNNRTQCVAQLRFDHIWIMNGKWIPSPNNTVVR